MGLLPVNNIISFRKVSIGIEGHLLSTGSLEMHIPEVMRSWGETMQYMMNAGGWGVGKGKEKRELEYLDLGLGNFSQLRFSLLKTTEFLLFLPILLYRFMIGIQYIT